MKFIAAIYKISRRAAVRGFSERAFRRPCAPPIWAGVLTAAGICVNIIPGLRHFCGRRRRKNYEACGVAAADSAEKISEKFLRFMSLL